MSTSLYSGSFFFSLYFFPNMAVPYPSVSCIGSSQGRPAARLAALRALGVMVSMFDMPGRPVMMDTEEKTCFLKEPCFAEIPCPLYSSHSQTKTNKDTKRPEQSPLAGYMRSHPLAACG